MSQSPWCAVVAAAMLTSVVSATIPLETVIVTAARVSQPIDQALASVTVITRADIERAQARSIDELLAGVEGLALSRAGGAGQVTSVFLRGSESDHTLWLIDGVRIGSVTTGIPALQDLPVDTIERIEIVRGARSGLYGPDAIGGVIQIFTRRGPAIEPSWRFTAGSNGTRHVSASVGLAGAPGWVDLQATHFETEGTNACLGRPFPPGGGCFTDEPDRDAYRNIAFNLRAGATLGGLGDIEAFVQHAQADVEFDRAAFNESDLVNSVAGVRVVSSFAGGRSVFTMGRAADRSTSFRVGSALTSTYDSERDTVSWQFERGDAQRSWVLGLDGLRDRVASDTAYTQSSRDNVAAFGQWSSQFGRHRMEWVGRYDDNEQFGGNATGQLSWGFTPSEGWQAYASIGNAFKAPSFNELYFPGFSNPSLDPERAFTLEAGIKRRLGTTRWSISAYRSEVKDLIAFDLKTYLPQNIAAARLEGVDASAQWERGPWRFEQTLGWLKARDRGALVSGRSLPRRPEWSGRTALGWQEGAFDLSASVQFAGRRYDDLANTRALGGYALLDVTAGWQFAAGLQMQVRVSNALDRAYETATLYPAPGREVLITVRHRAP